MSLFVQALKVYALLTGKYRIYEGWHKELSSREKLSPPAESLDYVLEKIQVSDPWYGMQNLLGFVNGKKAHIPDYEKLGAHNRTCSFITSPVYVDKGIYLAHPHNSADSFAPGGQCRSGPGVKKCAALADRQTLSVT